MLARHFSLDLYLDNVFGTVMLLAGTGLTIAAAAHWLPLEIGLLGVVAFGYGKLLMIGAMLRQLEMREVRAFDLGKKAAKSMYN